MESLFIVLGAAICLVVGYLVISKINSLSHLAVVLPLLAGLATAIGLLYSTGRTVVYTSTAQSASFLSTDTVEKVCGEKNVANTLCYKEVEYRGYPFKLIGIEYPPNSEPVVRMTNGSGRASGLFTNYMIYLLVFSVIAWLITTMRSSKSFKDR